MNQTIELGLDTFGDVTDGAGRQAAACRQVIRNLVEEAVLADRGRRRLHRRRRASPRRFRRLVARNGAGRDREPHQAHPPRLRGDGAVAPTIRSASSSASRRSMPSRTGAPRSSSAAARSPSRSRCSALTQAIRGAVQREARPVRRRAHGSSRSTGRARLRPPLDDQSVYPQTESGRLTTWIGVGGSPESVVRAAHYGMPMMLAIIGGDPKRFVPYADLTAARSTRWEGRTADRRAFARPRRRDRRAGARGAIRRLQAHARQDRRRARLAADEPRANSSARSRAVRSMSDRRRRSRARSRRPRRRSASRVST